MEITHSANFTDFDKFMIFVEAKREEGLAFNFSGNVSDSANDQDNFSINWTSEEEV